MFISQSSKAKLHQQLDLLVLLVKKDITLKYKRTYLGILWSLLNPILTAIVLYIAFNIFMRFQMKNYTLFLLAALFPWNWFSASVLLSSGTLTADINLIKRVMFPRHFLVLATILGQLVNLLFSFPILIGLVYFYDKSVHINWLLGVPLLLIIQFTVTLGISLSLSMINAFFRDMEYIIGVCINFLFWLTPIIYPLKAIPEEYRIYLLFNPLTYLMGAWRELFLNNTIAWSYIYTSAITAIIFLLIGVAIFKLLGKRLDEVL